MLVKNRVFNLFREPEQPKKPHYHTTGLSIFTVINSSCTLVRNISG